ncbi:MAG: lysylphosphatidylglycerol synthase transmembrane domain-containing protein [Gemmatimonadaceae bacterium]
MTAARRRWLRVVALLALATLLLAFGRGVDWRAAAEATRTADLGLLVLALVANQISLVLKAVRWWVFLRPLGIRSLMLVVRATFAGASLNNLVVAQGGEGARVLLVSRATAVSSARVAAALALERVLDAVSYLVLLVSAAWMLNLPDALLRWRVAASIALGVVVVALLLLSVAHRRDAPPDAPRGRVRSYVQRFASSAHDLATPARLAVAMLLSLGAWALQVVTYHVVALAAHLPISLTGTIAALLAIGISFLIRATPGNVGVFQLIYAMTVRGFGIAEGPAVAAALLIQTIQVLPTIALGTLMSGGLLGLGKNDEERLAKLSRPR